MTRFSLLMPAALAVALVACLHPGTAGSASTSVAPGDAAALAAARTTCTATGAAYKGLAFPASPRSSSTFNGSNDFAMFSTTRNGVWGGVQYRAKTADLYAVTWRPGSKVRVLQRFRWRSFITYNVPGSVDMVGIDPQGIPVASVQSTSVRPNGDYRTRLGVWWDKAGHPHYLAHGKSWLAWEPTGVSDSGRIVGWAASGSTTQPRYYLATWAHVNSPVQILATLGYDQPSVGIDGAGDIVYTDANGKPHLRSSTGATHDLLLPVGGRITSVGSSAQSVYAATTGGVVVWPARTASSVGALRGTAMAAGSATSAVDAVGPRGDVVMDAPGPARLRTASGAVVRLPALALYTPWHAVAIDKNGMVAYTAKSDRRVHFLKCH